MHKLLIDYPDEVLFSLKENEESFNKLAKEAMVVKLYEIGKLSSGISSKILDLSRVDFLDLLAKYKVSIYDHMTQEDLERDIKAIDG